MTPENLGPRTKGEWEIRLHSAVITTALALAVALIAGHLEWETVTRVSISVGAITAAQIEPARRGLRLARQLESLAQVNKVLYDTIRKM